MLVLGIETSCDETGLALCRDGEELLAVQLASSLKEHQKFGGVIPEIASRAHVELLTAELEALFEQAQLKPNQIDRIAVTYGPGLPGALLVGVAFAKALGLGLEKEVVGVNHLQAHVYAALMRDRRWGLDEPMVGLVISGGHTALIEMQGIQDYRLLGQTRDDAVGEAFDKVAKLLGLGFPGGPVIQKIAETGNKEAFRFAPPKMKSGAQFDFSLSGIKTAVLHKVQAHAKDHGLDLTQGPLRYDQIKEALDPQFVADMAASFQWSVVQWVVEKTIAAAQACRAPYLVFGGGVMANKPLREHIELRAAEEGIATAIPAFDLCTDNGAMIAGLGAHMQPLSLEGLKATPNLSVEKS